MRETDLHGTYKKRRSTPGRIFMCGLVAVMLLATMPVGVVADDEVVVFPDTGLEAVVRDALDKPNGDVTVGDMAMLSSLDADDEAIRDLTGLEYAVNLRDLDLDSNEISNLDPLANLTNLRSLDLEENQITNITSLANLTNLRDLDLEENQITNITSLAGLANLSDIDLDENEISDISPLVAGDMLRPGSTVEVRRNYLDLASGSAAMRDIEALERRGVNVRYMPQRR